MNPPQNAQNRPEQQLNVAESLSRMIETIGQTQEAFREWLAGERIRQEKRGAWQNVSSGFGTAEEGLTIQTAFNTGFTYDCAFIPTSVKISLSWLLILGVLVDDPPADLSILLWGTDYGKDWDVSNPIFLAPLSTMIPFESIGGSTGGSSEFTQNGNADITGNIDPTTGDVVETLANFAATINSTGSGAGQTLNQMKIGFHLDKTLPLTFKKYRVGVFSEAGYLGRGGAVPPQINITCFS